MPRLHETAGPLVSKKYHCYCHVFGAREHGLEAPLCTPRPQVAIAASWSCAVAGSGRRALRPCGGTRGPHSTPVLAAYGDAGEVLFVNFDGERERESGGGGGCTHVEHHEKVGDLGADLAAYSETADGDGRRWGPRWAC
jgi:hypothetical protein